MVAGYMKNFFDMIYGLKLSYNTIMNGKRDVMDNEPEKKVLIMGNGPSLNSTDMEKLKSEVSDIACVNFFPLKDERFFALKPQYLCLLDPVFFTKSENSMETKKNELLCILEKVDWPLKIICIQNNTLPIKNEKIKYCYLCKSAFVGKNIKRFRYFLYRNNLVNLGYQNVIIGAGFYFVSKQVKEIYLAGVDMSEFKLLEVDEDNDICVNTQHHYGNEKIKHSELGVIKKGEFYKLLNCYVKMFEQFHYLEEYAVFQGVKIYNLSPNSFIDVFEKRQDFIKL